MSPTSSPYYPPRSRGYRCFAQVRANLRRRATLVRIYRSDIPSLNNLLKNFFIPGLAFHVRNQPLLVKLSMLAYALLFLCFIAGLGRHFGNYALGLMLAIHAYGFCYYCWPWLVVKNFWFRIAFTLATMASVVLVVYTPACAFLYYWLTPLQRNGHVIIVHRTILAPALNRGDSVAYMLAGYTRRGDETASEPVGLTLGKVLAKEGDHIEFSADHFSVNGIAQPLCPFMPHEGSLMVQENECFIWPEFSVRREHMGNNQELVPSIMLKRAQVSESQLVGIPFKRWFWWRQELP